MMKGVTFNIFWLITVKGHRRKERSAVAVVADEISRSGCECVRFSSAARGGKYKHSDAWGGGAFPLMNGRIDVRIFTFLIR